MTPDRATSPLHSLCELIADCPHSTPMWTEAGVIVLRSQNIRGGRLDLSNPSYTDEDHFLDRVRRAEPTAGDLVITREAPMGEVCQIPPGLRCCLGQRMVLLRPDGTKIDSRFLLFALQSRAVQTQINWAEGTGSTVSNLRIPDLKNLQIPSPPLEQQRAIAHILGTLDDKIELNRRRNQTLEAMARALFKDWFVDFGPVRAKMEGRAPYLPPDLWQHFPDRLDNEGKPQGWAKRTVGECFNLTMGQSPPGDTYNDIGDGLPFFQGRTDFGFRYPENRKYCSAPKRIANPEDTLVSVRAPVGDINLAWVKCCVGRGVAAVRHLSSLRSFTYHAIWSIQEELRHYEHTGTVFGAINKKQFEAIGFIEPIPDIIQCFEMRASPMDDEIRNNLKESRTLAQLRDTLLPKLISGELRIADPEQFLETHT